MLTEVLFGPATMKELEEGECELLVSIRFDDRETKLDFMDRSDRIAEMLLDLEDDIEVEEMERYGKARLLWQSERI